MNKRVRWKCVLSWGHIFDNLLTKRVKIIQHLCDIPVRYYFSMAVWFCGYGLHRSIPQSIEQTTPFSFGSVILYWAMGPVHTSHRF